MPRRSPNVFTIAPSAPFAETLVRGLIARVGREPLALADATIYLPTRRAARFFADVFARVLGGAALLPEFRPLGDVDEDELLFDAGAEDFTALPAIAPLRRRLLLAALIRRFDAARGTGPMSFAQASALASGLAQVMDEAETQGADLSQLNSLVPAALAAHWAQVSVFLSLLRDEWPKLLAAEGAVNPATRRNEMLRALAKRLNAHPPDKLIVAAGSTGSIPATGELLGTIARLPKGMIVLPGLDRELDEESWDKLDAGHPQYGMKQLLTRIVVGREDVADWQETPVNTSRELVLREALRPAPTTDAWRALAEKGSGEIKAGLEGLSLIHAADPAEESLAIALSLREALETPGGTAALVTQDRTLARRVAAELERWEIAVDDSAGQPLAHTAPGAFLCLLAETADTAFAPVALLALLKHPLAIMGEELGCVRAHARLLDLCLRGPRPDSGLDGIAKAIAAARVNAKDDARKELSELQSWFARLTAILQPLASMLGVREAAIAEMLAAHIEAAEILSTDAKGEILLWRREAGETASKLVGDLLLASADLPKIEARSYAPLFRTLAMEADVRPSFGRHPRLAILGPQEARLLSFDLMVMAGLNEGSWPRAAANDPWFSRPMRKAIGLEPPERAIGLSAHDFATLAAQPDTILLRALKADGTPTIASRWLQRLVQLTRGLNLEHALAPATDYVAIARALNEPVASERMKRPAPRPPVKARPRKLSVTEIETWLRDPYAIYAKRVLRLAPLEPLDAAIGALERGRAVHKALELFVRQFPDDLPDDAAMQLIAIADQVFGELNTPKAALAMWRPRFIHAAHWFVGIERERRANIARSHVEIRGERGFPGPAGAFVLFGYADRIDELRSGGAAILDYKTGAPPSEKQVRELLTPQLPLEAAILAEGGFAGVGKLEAKELTYIRFGGGAKPGEVRPIKADAREIALEAAAKLGERIAFFDEETTPYLSRVRPYRADVSGDYDHLARVREWSLSGWEESGE